MKKRSFLLPLTTILIALAIVWGNVVSSKGAGLACPDWPLCHGKLIPPPEKYVLIEYFHRLIALGVFICAAYSAVSVFRHFPPFYKKLMGFAMVLLVIQILLGGIAVLLKLPASIATIHLANSLAVFLLFSVMTTASLLRKTEARISLRFLVMIGLIFLQAALGALVRHTHSGLSCGVEFPACRGHLWPPMETANIAIHFFHRLLGYLIALKLTVFGFIFVKSGKKFLGFSLIVLVLLQIFLGALTVLTTLATWAASLHLSNALLLLLLLVYFGLNEDNKGNENTGN